MYASNRTIFRFVLLAGAAVICAALALARSPFARAADLTAANEAELVAAITAVNAAGAGDHTIILTADITLTAPLPALNNTVAAGITLDGAGHTLDADGAGTALAVMPLTTVTVQDITITGGAGNSGNDGQSGGGLFNRGTLTVVDAVITGNTASQGAGIFNYAGETGAADLTLTRVTLSDNEASNSGGAVANTGDTGATTVTITDSTLSGNSAVNYGGGLVSNGHSGTATVTLTNTTVANNTAGNGGGLFNNGNNGTATLNLYAVTLSGNTASGNGGGLFNNGNNGTATATLTNVTVSGNAAKTGGGLMNSGNGGDADLSLSFTTVAGNTATNGASGLHNTSGASADVAASILAAGAQGKACVSGGGATLTSLGYNLGNDGNCNLAAIGDIPDGDPALAALALNAPGDTATHAIGPNSDAQRRVPAGTLDCGVGVSADQRGALRPFPGSFCDIGAYESDASEDGTPAPTATATPTVTGTPPSPTPTVTGTPPSPTPTATATIPSTPTSCTPPYTAAAEAQLHHAIDCVNNEGAGVHTITLTADITLSGAAPPLDNPAADEIILDGDGHTLDGDRSGTVLTVAAGTTARVRDVTITGGQGSRGSGGWGGGIYNAGILTVENSTLTGNLATRGGAIANHGAGVAAELTLVRSTLSGNAATVSGGGILNIAGEGGSALLNVVNATLSGNVAAAGGGGLFNEAAGGNAGANLVYATLALNTATAGGGGIHTVAAGGNSSVTLAATIVTNGAGTGPDCARPSGTLVSTGYNLAGDGTCNLTQGNDQPAADARLLPLALNAPGNTATHALALNSPALDRVHGGAAGCGSALSTDQRGAPRPMPAGGMCDVGAFERQTQTEAGFVIYLPVGLDR